MRHDLGQRVEHQGMSVTSLGVQCVLADGADISGDISVSRAIVFDVIKHPAGLFRDVVHGSWRVRESRDFLCASADKGRILCHFFKEMGTRR